MWTLCHVTSEMCDELRYHQMDMKGIAHDGHRFFITLLFWVPTSVFISSMSPWRQMVADTEAATAAAAAAAATISCLTQERHLFDFLSRCGVGLYLARR